MAVRDDFTAGEVLAAADLNDTFGAKLDLAGGKVLQVVRATDVTLRATTSTTYVDVTGVSVTITPERSTSVVLIIATFDAIAFSTTQLGTYTQQFQITDASNNALSGAENGRQVIAEFSTAASPALKVIANAVTMIGYSAPATTSATTYKLRHKVNDANVTGRVDGSNTTTQLFAIEVSA
jgi:hypothetical protein